VTLDQLRYFKVLAEMLNYTKAAECLFISQPALSSAIGRLEYEVGAKLLERSRAGKASLTEAGESFYEHVCLALANIDNGIQLAREAERGVLNSTVRIGAIPCVQGAAWSRMVYSFRVESPLNPTYSIRQAHSAELTGQLLRGEIDVAFMSKVGDDSRINYRLCGKQPIVLCVNSKHPWAHLQSVPVDKLDGRTVLTYEDANPAAPAVKRALSSRGVTLQNAFLDEMTMASLVQVDMQSMAVFCYSLVVEAIDGIAIIRIDGLSERMCNDVYFAYAKTSQRAVSAGFIEHVLKCLEARESLLPEP
jgi:DNA-binding transcriptional LysR family regulator